ncbi:Two-component system sensor histidine kinase-response regulator hybrid protein (fragment) [Xanthomonas citri pv. fuscans]|uniref:histidine kinase n=1 Tax=Xanthomonas campestris pv. phaseoli TaxID=317013 RepID=A0A7Z7J225_XANCH
MPSRQPSIPHSSPGSWLISCTPVADARGLRFEYRNQLPTHVVVVGDATRVRQILINLLGNAIKFADRGEVSLTVSQHGDALRFTVREGSWHRAGTAEAIVPALRTRRGCAHQFARRRQRAWAGDLPGTHRGDERPNPRGQPAWCRHPVHRGSALPIDRSGTHIAAGQVQLLAGEPLRILLVEDDPAVAEVISGLSTNRGHRVVHAVHGLAALSETVDGRFDIALLDLDLPGGTASPWHFRCVSLAIASRCRRSRHRLTALRRPRRRPQASTDSRANRSLPICGWKRLRLRATL